MVSRQRLKRVVFPLAFAVVGAVGGFLAGRAGIGLLPEWTLPRPGGPLEILAAAVILLVLVFLVILLHELGHVAGGELAGFRFLTLAVGPLRLFRDASGLRLEWNRNPGMAGGYAITMPEDDRDLRRRMGLVVAGGPASSLLLALLCFAAWVPLRDSGALLAVALFATGTLSALVFGATMIPFGGASQPLSDGARLLMLARGGARADRWCGIAALAGALAAGLRPRDWNPSIVQHTIALADQSFDGVAVHVLAYEWTLDRGQIAEAGAWLDRAVDLLAVWPPPFRGSIHVEAAWYSAWFRNDAETARRHLQLSRGGLMIEPSSILRARAAIAAAEGGDEEARRLIGEAIDATRGARIAGYARAERAWLEDMLCAAKA